MARKQPAKTSTQDQAAVTLPPFTVDKKGSKGGAPVAGPTRTQPHPPKTPKGTTVNPVPKGVQHQSDGRHNAQGISIEKYNRMFQAYMEVQSVQYVANTCTVNRRTAKKYIEHGDPHRYMEALAMRRQRILQSAWGDERQAWADAMEKWKAPLAALRLFISKAISEAVNDPKVYASLKRNPKAVIEMASKIMLAESYIYGGPKSQPSRDTVAEFEGWTPDELLTFAETGQRPAWLSESQQPNPYGQ